MKIRGRRFIVPALLIISIILATVFLSILASSSSEGSSDFSSKFSSLIQPSFKIFLSEEEWKEQEALRMQDPHWLSLYYNVCDIECFIPEPMNGEEINLYFSSLNYSEKDIYFKIQFNVPGADPSYAQVATLKRDGIILLGLAEGHTYYARAPIVILRTKSYDFVRWAGITSAEGKLDENLRAILGKGNPRGDIPVFIELYETSSEYLNLLRSQGIKIESSEGLELQTRIAKEDLIEIASLWFVKKIEEIPHNTLSLSLSLLRSMWL